MKRQCKMTLPARVIEQNIASVTLKLEYILFVPVTALDQLQQELHYLLTIPFVLITYNSYSYILRSHSVQVQSRLLESLLKMCANLVLQLKPLQNMAPDYSLQNKLAVDQYTAHQQMIVYHISVSHPKAKLEVVNVSTLPVDVLKRKVAANLRQRCSEINQAHSANSFWLNC